MDDSIQITFLSVPVEWPRWCSVCESNCLFIADRELAFGLMGQCQGCGNHFWTPFTRATSRAA
jgi:hypothetical protein